MVSNEYLFDIFIYLAHLAFYLRSVECAPILPSMERKSEPTTRSLKHTGMHRGSALGYRAKPKAEGEGEEHRKACDVAWI